MLGAITGVSWAADALRAFARRNIEAATEVTTSMGHYTHRAVGAHAA